MRINYIETELERIEKAKPTASKPKRSTLTVAGGFLSIAAGIAIGVIIFNAMTLVRVYDTWDIHYVGQCFFIRKNDTFIPTYEKCFYDGPELTREQLEAAGERAMDSLQHPEKYQPTSAIEIDPVVPLIKITKEWTFTYESTDGKNVSLLFTPENINRGKNKKFMRFFIDGAPSDAAYSFVVAFPNGRKLDDFNNDFIITEFKYWYVNPEI